MKVHNMPSCETCESYSPQSFKIKEYSCGRMETPNQNTDSIIFLLSGRLSIKPDDNQEYICEANEMILFVRNREYEINVLENARCLTYSFVTSYLVCEKMSKKDEENIFYNYQYKFCSLEIKKPMTLMLESVIYYLEDDINCRYWQQSKHLEFFVVFWNYYTLEEIRRFFYPVLNKEIGFYAKVIANHRKAKTVTELAKLCGYSLPTFNKLFAEHFKDISPYKWMLQQNASLIKAKLFDKTIPIKAIVAEFGFIDQSYFNKYCKRFFGATAYQVRKGND